MQLDVNLKPRMDHSITAVSVASEVTEVTMFGGSIDWNRNIETISEIVVLHFGENNRL